MNNIPLIKTCLSPVRRYMLESFYSKLCKILLPRLHDELNKKLSNDLYTRLNKQLYDDLHQKWQNELYENLSKRLYDKLIEDDLIENVHKHLYMSLRKQLHSELSNSLWSKLHTELFKALHDELFVKLHSELVKGVDSLALNLEKKDVSGDDGLEKRYHATTFTSIFNENNKAWLSKLKLGDKVSFKINENGRYPTMQVWTGYGLLGKLPTKEAEYFSKNNALINLGYVCEKLTMTDDIGFIFVIVIPYTIPKNGRPSPKNEGLGLNDNEEESLYYRAISEMDRLSEMAEDMIGMNTPIAHDLDTIGWGRILEDNIERTDD